MPQLARLISSDLRLNLKRKGYELVRKVSREAPSMDVFLHLDDPYSYLLIQVLPELYKRYNVSIKLHIIEHINQDMFPEVEMWSKYALKDAQYVAKRYGLNLLKNKPDHSFNEKKFYINQSIKLESLDNALNNLCVLFNKYWNHSLTENIGFQDEALTNDKLRENEALLERLGHYMSAMIYFEGEWYWGIDRLDHFERRANALNLSNTIAPTVNYTRTQTAFNHRQAFSTQHADRLKQSHLNNTAPLVLYFSIRSPYSYLGLEHAVFLAEHYGIPLIVKPVLPMVMRGLKVPNAKKMYIFHDTKREAKKYGLDYGYVADPLGAGVERCYALFEYAKSQGKGTEYLLSYSRAVNALGIRSETDKGLKYIVESIGLDWNTAKPLLANTDWKQWAESNLKEMYSLGLWGVPSYHYQDTAVWGQDRLFVIESIIKQND